ncbi:hypothetical protein CTATCC11996_15123 [Comamonas testosteroni ATCC 11996]|nr:hypothetical protein CTATCC11996_15123 [Comamonas testosteroni ATCC 11996]
MRVIKVSFLYEGGMALACLSGSDRRLALFLGAVGLLLSDYKNMSMLRLLYIDFSMNMI